MARPAFDDREAAGRALARLLAPAPDPDALVLALPRGGVPVAAQVAAALGCPLAPVHARKLPIPAAPEMGFGAVTLDGTVVLNRPVMRLFGVDDRTAGTIAAEVRGEVARRSLVYGGDDETADPEGRRVILIDDGLATGYTMLAAAGMALKRRPALLLVAVPCAAADAVMRVAEGCDELYCLFEQHAPPFAVASYYRSFPDLTDAEVIRYLGRASPQTH